MGGKGMEVAAAAAPWMWQPTVWHGWWLRAINSETFGGGGVGQAER